MRAEARLAGVCNIAGAHWVGISIELLTKAVTLYDSGSHFESLRDGVRGALTSLYDLGKGLCLLMEKMAQESLPKNVSRTPVDAGASSSKKEKGWTTRCLTSPRQDDTTICGPLAFSFVWHTVHERRFRLQAGDSSALRLEMLDIIFRDVQSQAEALALRSAPAALIRDGSIPSTG